MPAKTIKIANLGDVAFYKRKNSRSIRISISHSGEVKVTLPRYISYLQAQQFVKSKISWIKTQQSSRSYELTSNQIIGKEHLLILEQSSSVNKPTAKLTLDTVLVRYPYTNSSSDNAVQLYTKKQINKALKQEAEKYLPDRLNNLANIHGFSVNSVKIKHLKSRWGSCNSLKDITLNSQLMTLPWDLIDYVLMHELIHTLVMRHGRDFWTKFREYQPNVETLRKQIKLEKPIV